MAGADDLTRYRNNFQEEVDQASLYRLLADLESSPELGQVYERLAESEDRHARFWVEQMEQAGAAPPPMRPSWRARMLGWLARRLGPQILISTLAATEQVNQTIYDDQPETVGTGMAADERSHARMLKALSEDTPRGVQGSSLAHLEGRHRSVGGNALRAAVLGANDGLVSNLSLVMGVAGATFSNQAILIAGIAGLLAGASSMALGEWISVKSSRELYEHQLEVEAAEIAAFPEEELEELALIYQAKGLPEKHARRLAEHVMVDETMALDTMAREELGIDPDELGGSPRSAALASFVLFALGAVIPVVPFLFLSAWTAILTSVVLSGIGLFALGAGITVITGRGILFSAGRQLLFGLGAAAIVFAVGRLLGVTVAG